MTVIQTIAAIGAAAWIIGILTAAFIILRGCRKAPPPRSKPDEAKDPGAYADSFWRPGSGPLL